MGELERQGYSPLYDVLLRSASHEHLDKKNKDRLKLAIYDLARQNYKAAAYVLVPNYFPFKMGTSIVHEKMDFNAMGGNNPTYWVALKLASEGISMPGCYTVNFFQNTNSQYEVPLPTDKKILEFAASIKPDKHWVLWSDKIKMEKSIGEFIFKIKHSNLF